MFDSSILRAVPDKIGVYAFFRQSRLGAKRTCAYVGTSGGEQTRAGVRTRLKQHLVEQTSTTCSRRNPAGVFVDRLTHVYVWIDPQIKARTEAQAAELIFMAELKPLLRTEGSITPEARKKAEEPEFRAAMLRLLQTPTQVITLPGLDNTAMLADELRARMDKLETRMGRLEDRIDKQGRQG